ncbi:MAG: hypothetical protein L0215_24200 [Gemmataceae bacterium]|nr:hypothetical protein [Gemmataceae bacterium]
MPYWSIYCLYCSGYIADALLECLPAGKKANSAFVDLCNARPGAALACPYCNGLIGFDNNGKPQIPQKAWPVFRYGLAELEAKKLADGELAQTSLADWALQHRFTKPGTHEPLKNYTYAEQAPPDEIVP